MRCRTLLICVLLGGCATVGPLPDVATVQPPARYAYAPETAPDVPLASLLPQADTGFVTLLAQARQSAPTLGAALARVDAARAQLQSAGANRLPNLSGNLGVTTQRNSSSAIGGNLPNGAVFDVNRNQLQSGLNASWDADLFGGLRASQRASSARLDAAGADAAAVRLALECDLALAVIDYRDANAREAVVQRDVADAQDLVRLTRIRAKAGIVPGFDVVRAEALLRDAQTRLTPFLGEKANAVGRLISLTALDGQTILSALGKASVSSAPPVLASGVPSQLLRNRPDVQATERRLAAANADVAVAAAARFPRFSITGALGLVALAAGDIFNGKALNASLGASVGGSIFDFGRVQADIKANEARALEAFALYRGAVFRALGETEAVLAAQVSARDAVAAIAGRLETDRDTLAIARERYRLGIADFLTVIDTQRTLNSSRQISEANKAAAARAAVQLYRALGGITQG